MFFRQFAKGCAVFQLPLRKHEILLLNVSLSAFWRGADRKAHQFPSRRFSILHSYGCSCLDQTLGPGNKTWPDSAISVPVSEIATQVSFYIDVQNKIVMGMSVTELPPIDRQARHVRHPVRSSIAGFFCSEIQGQNELLLNLVRITLRRGTILNFRKYSLRTAKITLLQ